MLLGSFYLNMFIPFHTPGERGGPSWSYFVPYLSAIHIFANGVQSGEANFKYNEESGSRECHSGFVYYESQEPYSRAPLYERLKQLGDREDSAQAQDGSGPFIRFEKLANIHPSSWFSIAWYPIYRIPEASVWGRFLTYHRLLPVFFFERDFMLQPGGVGMQPGRPASAQAIAGRGGLDEMEGTEPDNLDDFSLPAVGALWYNTAKEHWFELLPDPLKEGGDGRPTSRGGPVRVLLGELSPSFDRLDKLEQVAHYIAEQHMVDPIDVKAENMDVHNSV